MGIWVKDGLTMHLQNILELRSENIDYILVNISASIQDPRLCFGYVIRFPYMHL